jgi:hypothetical protein
MDVRRSPAPRLGDKEPDSAGQDAGRRIAVFVAVGSLHLLVYALLRAHNLLGAGAHAAGASSRSVHLLAWFPLRPQYLLHGPEYAFPHHQPGNAPS